jgi:hypothetical protein
MKQIAIAITVLFTVAGCEFLGDIAALQAADFYECPPGRTLVVCAPGTGPPNAECTDVGSGQTTIAPRNCT